MITAQIEQLEPILEEIKPLLQPHYEELALDKEHVPLYPQYDEYIRRERLGNLVMATVRKDGVLAGYLIAFVAPGLHYKTCLTCHMDIIRIAEWARGGMTALKLMRCFMKETRRRGVNRWFMGKKIHAGIDIGRLYEAFGFRPVEVTYSLYEG